ncbi:NAD(P)-binding protein [Gonapodya prolifera JEL478]|uniref:NAD(P)-binding protein n=1 Tax=Gonapodya prolifera (strain JEL478) TaxID=1344416 RepID=A0A139A014_GONPJ|nr:NAD(P)-binding protein [Gonapodya prolifera JEL478]|eukprot:KXS10111.1 NAD(P)-binding protein [Gonapodya prolifera JEL478]
MSLSKLSLMGHSAAGRVAVITGAGSGLGRATAHLFADEKSKIAVLDINLDNASKVVEEIESVHGKGVAHALKVDVRNTDNVKAVVDDVAKHFGRIDFLINSAGVGIAPGLTMDAHAWDNADFLKNYEFVMDINVTGTARMIQACVPHLAKAAAENDTPLNTSTPWSNTSRIVNMASIAAVRVSGMTAYDVSKHAILGLTRSAATRLGPKGIAVNCVAPGPVFTPLTEAYTGPFIRQLASEKPHRRPEFPEDVAQAILMLCRPSASAMNGNIVEIDGGCRNMMFGHPYNFDALKDKS